MKDLQHRMGLDDWIVHWDADVGDKSAWGENSADWEEKESFISIRKGLRGKDRKITQVHELIHCHTAALRSLDKIERLVSPEIFRKIERIINKKEEEIVMSLEEPIYNLIYHVDPETGD